MRSAMHSERARQWVHIGSGLFALLLRILTWWQAAALATFALVFNALALPRVGGRRLYRPVDEARGFPLGILLYPLAVLLLALLFPSRLDIVAAAWAILAFGDGFATLIGRAVSNRTTPAATRTGHLPWNADKTIAGTAAFIICGALGGIAFAWWVSPAVVPRPPLAFTILAPLAAAIAAGFVETIPVRLDDNISVPATAAAVLWIASLMDVDAWQSSRQAVLSAVPWGVAVNAATAWLGYRAKTVSRSGALAGFCVGLLIYAGGGAGAWVLLFVTFLAASITSRLGLQRKMMLGIAEERGGRRGAGNAIANCGVAAAAAVAAATTPYGGTALLAVVASLAAGGSDTVASEIGKAWGRSTFLITSFGRVKAGTPGAMSLEGTAAGMIAAFGLAAVGVAAALIPASAIITVVVAATAGAVVESALGATLEAPGILNNDLLNFINTSVAAAVALWLA
jgi:uncharacterized protein (TIGR00297 family)